MALGHSALQFGLWSDLDSANERVGGLGRGALRES